MVTMYTSAQMLDLMLCVGSNIWTYNCRLTIDQRKNNMHSQRNYCFFEASEAKSAWLLDVGRNWLR